MNPLVASTAAIAVSAIFCLWRSYRQTISHRQRLVRERVAYMLWVAAQRDEWIERDLLWPFT